MLWYQYLPYNQVGWLSDKAVDSSWGMLSSNLCHDTAILTEAYRGSPKSLQENFW
jgi:hypothetical protein